MIRRAWTMPTRDYDGLTSDGTHLWALSTNRLYRMDFMIHRQDPLLTGATAVLTVRDAGPAAEARFVASLFETPQAACYPTFGGLCLDLSPPIVFLGHATADANGTAQLPVSVGTVPPGITVWTQVAVTPSFSQVLKGPWRTTPVVMSSTN